VEAVGAAAEGFAQGQRVYGMPGFERGTYATHILMKPSELAVLPAHMDMSGAGAVPLAALTAWQGLFDHGDLQKGEHVLVHGAAGGVGHLAVQFAKVRGAHVTATGRGADRDFLHGLHADRVIDTDAQDFTDMDADVDLVFDLLGGEVQMKSWAVLKDGGRMISTLEEPDAGTARDKGAKAARYMAEPNGAQLAEIADLIAAGRVHVAVDRSFPFAQLDAAHRRLEEAHVQGKVIVTIDDEDEG
jgi:NADPH:quinone reductase-like Zn-dependent oxidoreductase